MFFKRKTETKEQTHIVAYVNGSWVHRHSANLDNLLANLPANGEYVICSDAMDAQTKVRAWSK